MAKDKYGNEDWALTEFAKIIREGGKIVCNPLQYFAILEAAKGWNLEYDMKEKLRPDALCPRGKVLAVSPNLAAKQGLTFQFTHTWSG